MDRNQTYVELTNFLKPENNPCNLINLLIFFINEVPGEKFFIYEVFDNFR